MSVALDTNILTRAAQPAQPTHNQTTHDARIVAAMVVHGITQLLTFNAADFNRFSDIVVLTPAGVLNQAPSS